MAKVETVQVLGAKHAQQHRAREQRVGARSETRCRRRRRPVAFFHSQNNLLLGPDHQPNVEEHESTTQCPHPDQRTANKITEGTNVVQQHQAGQEGIHRTPAKPPKCPWSQLFHGIRFRVGLSFLEVFCLYKVEVIQHAYPDNAHYYVRPPKNKLDCSFH